MGDVKESSDAEGRLMVMVALNGGSKSAAIMRWAIEKFVYEGSNVSFKLLHVFPRITGVPTPMGNLIPLPQVRNDVVSAYKKEVEWQKTEMLLPYQKLCSLKKVPADITLVESDEISTAISLEVAKFGAKNLIIGASSNSLFSRKVKGQLLSSLISGCAPGFCNVFVVSKGKLEFLRPSEKGNWNPLDDSTSASGDSAFSSSRYSSSTLDLGNDLLMSTFASTDPGSSTSDSPFSSPSRSMRRMDMFPNGKLYFNEVAQESIGVSHWRSNYPYYGKSMMEGCMISRVSSSRSDSSIPESTLSSSSRNNSFQSLSSMNQEIERLRMELRPIREMCVKAENETTDASEKTSDLSMLRSEEAKKAKEMNEKEEKAKELAKLEKAKKETHNSKEFALEEMYKRRGKELINVHAAKEKDKLKHSSFELRRKESSDLKDKVLEINCSGPKDPPSHFKCPILSDVMDDPCVASDGYTYDRRAIEMWLKDNDTSPTTDFPLSNKTLIPNNSLHYAIMEWKAKTKPPRNSLRSL